MNDKQNRIIEFTKKWIGYFEDDNSIESEIVDTSVFADECFVLGFAMDCGESFGLSFGRDAWDDYFVLKDKICDTKELDVLCSGLFSKWRYYNHWCQDESILEENSRKWFITILRRIQELSLNS